MGTVFSFFLYPTFCPIFSFYSLPPPPPFWGVAWGGVEGGGTGGGWDIAAVTVFFPLSSSTFAQTAARAHWELCASSDSAMLQCCSQRASNDAVVIRPNQCSG